MAHGKGCQIKGCLNSTKDSEGGNRERKSARSPKFF